MGVVDRNKGIPGLKPNYWINYTITEEQRRKFKRPRRTERESVDGGIRVARSLYALRMREVRDGTWQPPGEGGHGETLTQYADKWIAHRQAADVSGVRNEAQRLRDYVLPVLGSKPLTGITRTDVKHLVAGLQGRISVRTKRPLSPRAVLHIYGTLRTLYGDAVADEKVSASPCTLKQKRDELPVKRDVDPRWRAQAVFTRDEAEGLMSDSRIPPHRRVLYTLVLLGGMRIGEAVARRWRDYDPVASPLGRLSVATQHNEREVKTRNPRELPVHPVLASVLATWKLSGFELVHCRKPTLDDYIVPNVVRGKRGKSSLLSGERAWGNLQHDLKALGLRRRRMHDTRRTFISLAVADGADKYLLKFVTHGRPTANAFDDYVTPPWAALCEQVAKLKLAVREPQNNVIRMHKGEPVRR